MQTQLKQRIIGSVVILIVLVLFLPVLFHKQHPAVQAYKQDKSASQDNKSVISPAVVNNTQSIELQLPIRQVNSAQKEKHKVQSAGGSSSDKSALVVKKLSQVVSKTIPATQTAQQAQASKLTSASMTSKGGAMQKSPVTPHVRISKSASLTAINSSKIKLTRAVDRRPATTKVVAKKAVGNQQSKNRVAKTLSKENNLSHDMLVPASIDTSAAWVLQVASFTNAANAHHLVSLLRNKGYSAYIRKSSLQGDKVLARVFVGPEIQRSQLKQWQTRIKKDFGMSGIIIKYTI